MHETANVFKINKVIVNRFLPDNCWYLVASGYCPKIIYRTSNPLNDSVEGPTRGTYTCVFSDLNTHIWIRQFFSFWSHQFDSNMDLCCYAGSTPTAISAGRPVAPTTASLADW